MSLTHEMYCAQILCLNNKHLNLSLNLNWMLQMVVLMDPLDDPDDILRANRSREKQYMFDVSFDGSASQVSTWGQI